jgi:mannose-6-phosphate isomerase-like protein (cupin superfamily)
MAQTRVPAEIQPDSTTYANIHVKKISEDSLHSTFVIWIKQGVKGHYHQYHSEQIIVLEGTGTMSLDTSTFEISAGMHFTIPMGTPHAVVTTSDIPLKVLSIQSPRFDGDRIFIKP